MLHTELNVCFWWGSRGVDVNRHVDRKECTQEVSDGVRTGRGTGLEAMDVTF